MKVLITGANGQLGTALQAVAPSKINDQYLILTPVNKKVLDVSNAFAVEMFLNQEKPDVIINAAAFTLVDKAEAESALAHAVNAEAVKYIAEWCSKNKALFIQVSTDFVFDGKQARPYEPLDRVNPLNVYGITKLKAEQYLFASNCRYHVIRTGWVYAEHGANFVKTILRLASEREQLSVVADQIGTPTYAVHLAQMIWNIIERQPASTLWHFSDAGTASWYDFANAIVEEAAYLGLLTHIPKIKPIKTIEYPTPAMRPAFSVLDKALTWQQLEIEPIHWRSALRKMLVTLNKLKTVA
ncbi:MAG TPA: dTDP-4-dehydrorhamnose reductase [Cellvibrio sp.]|nr:dTDP-4-dehydrorhamnose reductase [Cellvibrio sp.]